MANNSKKYFSINDLTKKWDDLKVSVSFEIEQGKLVSLVGPSGCGKSTVLKMIAGLEKADNGSIYLDDVDITNLNCQQREIGMVFQIPALFQHLNVGQNISYGLVSKKVSRKEQEKSVLNILKEFSLEGFEKRKVQSLSGGEAQRVALARSLVLNPKILLLDEPFSALDKDLRFQLRVFLRKVQQEKNMTVIFVTHDMEEAVAISDLIGIMDKGSLINYGKTEDIKSIILKK